MDLDEVFTEWTKRGWTDRINWIKKADRIIPKSIKKRIQEDDKTVLQEIVLPDWVSWEFIREWSLQGSERQPDMMSCVICGNSNHGLDFKGKLICNNCLGEMQAFISKHNELKETLQETNNSNNNTIQ